MQAEGACKQLGAWDAASSCPDVLPPGSSLRAQRALAMACRALGVAARAREYQRLSRDALRAGRVVVGHIKGGDKADAVEHMLILAE